MPPFVSSAPASASGVPGAGSAGAAGGEVGWAIALGGASAGLVDGDGDGAAAVVAGGVAGAGSGEGEEASAGGWQAASAVAADSKANRRRFIQYCYHRRMEKERTLAFAPPARQKDETSLRLVASWLRCGRALEPEAVSSRSRSFDFKAVSARKSRGRGASTIALRGARIAFHYSR